MTDIFPFTDISIPNLTFAEMNVVHDNTPGEANFHVEKSILRPDRFTVLVEDLPYAAARDMFAALVAAGEVSGD